MNSLRVTAVLETGQVATIDGWIPLDSILALAWMRRRHPERVLINRAGGISGDELFHPELPLERREVAGEWFWACSFARYVKLAEEIAYWHKRFDDQREGYLDLGKRKGGRVNVKSGPLKNYRMPLVYMVTPELTWYLVGDREEVESLLTLVPAIGKKSAMGMGQVREWLVESHPNDCSCYDESGRLMRSIPDPEGPDHAGIRPPYWHPANQVRCRRPEEAAIVGV
jgi:CRISPR type IV-associated protein Csf3